MPRSTFLLCVCVLALPLRLAAAVPPTEDVPVPGGIDAMAKALGIAPTPDRARFVAELARLTHQTADDRNTTRARAASELGRSPSRPPAPVDTVPIPLSVRLWSDAVFGHSVAPDDIVAAILADPRAAHLSYGLAGLDDETLEFFGEHPAMMRDAYQRNAALFAAFGGALRIHDSRVQVPGGPGAAELWEGVVGERVDRPSAFVRALFAQDLGRLAYLYDAIFALDPAHTAFAVGSWIGDPAARQRQFRMLVAANRESAAQWQPARLPFTRPAYDVASLLRRVEVRPDGSPALMSSRSAWAWIFAGDDIPGHAPHLPADDGRIDAGWLAQAILPADTRVRGDRLDQLAFSYRVFHDAADGAMNDVVTAIRGFPRCRMLMLTLERAGVRRPALYAAAARQAQQLSALDDRRAAVALREFQGAVALIARMADVRSIDAGTTEALVGSLLAVPLGADGRYDGALSRWVQRELRPALPPADDVETAVLEALAGRRSVHVDAAAPVVWEGETYRLDIGAAEERRLVRIREKQGPPSLDAALADPDDALLAEALAAWTYAVSIADVDSPALLGESVARRHDFGLGPRERSTRRRMPWAQPRPEIATGVPWHVVGSLLGLDVAMSGLSLRRVSANRAIDAPTLSSNERDGFAIGVALLNPFELRNQDLDAIAAAVERGRGRIASLAEDGSHLPDVVAETRMDGWRARALQWTIAHEPRHAASLLSLTELLVLGGGRPADLDAWGAGALTVRGCLCTRLIATADWRLLIGRPQLGLMAELVADLNLHVALILRDLHVPAAAAKAVLSAAVQDFIDEVRPTDFNDWLTLVRTAQSVPRERIEDYVAVATSSGPLVPLP